MRLICDASFCTSSPHTVALPEVGFTGGIGGLADDDQHQGQKGDDPGQDFALAGDVFGHAGTICVIVFKRTP